MAFKISPAPSGASEALTRPAASEELGQNASLELAKTPACSAKEITPPGAGKAQPSGHLKSATCPALLEIAAKSTGLRPDQVRRAVEDYRSAGAELEAEPEWQAVMHMTAGGACLAQYAAAGTQVSLQIESWSERGETKEARRYIFAGRDYELFAEARAAELAAAARPRPYSMEAPNATA